MSVFERTRYPGIRRNAGSGRYNVQVKFHQTVVSSATFDTLESARKWRDGEVLKYTDATYSVRLGNTPLSDVIALWLASRASTVAESTFASDTYTVGKLPKRLLTKPIRSVSSDDLQRLLDGWGKELRPATLQRYSTTLKAFYRWAVRKGYLASSPMGVVDVPKARPAPKDFNPRSVDEILEAADEVGGLYGDAIAILALSGLRWGEARALRVGDVRIDGTSSRFHVVRSQVEGRHEKPPKSWKSRYVPVDPRILDRVQKLMAGKGPSDYLLSSDGVSQLWRSRFCQSVGWAERFPDMTIHDLRHTAAINWLKAGVPVNSVQAWLGHSDLKVTTLYTSFLGMDIDQSAYERLWQGIENKE